MPVVKYTSVNKRCAHLRIWSIWSETTQTPFNNMGTGNRVPAALCGTKRDPQGSLSYTHLYMMNPHRAKWLQPIR